MADTPQKPLKYRSQAWFDNPHNIDMTALYLERQLNFGWTREELQSGRPIIGIAQTGSDLSPCNRHHLVLAQRVREGIREMGAGFVEAALVATRDDTNFMDDHSRYGARSFGMPEVTHEGDSFLIYWKIDLYDNDPGRWRCGHRGHDLRRRLRRSGYRHLQ